MEADDGEVSPYLNRCRCCLEVKDDGLRDMWAEYILEECEVYGEMISECFALPLQHPTDHIEQICIPCIDRLRDAVQFKRDILNSEQAFNEYLSKDPKQNDGAVKMEVMEEEHVAEDDEEEYEVTYEEVYNQEECSEEDVAAADAAESGEVYLEIEYLEDEDTKGKADSEVKVRKWPKKKKKEERMKSYKNYTEEDLRSCIEAVQNGTMTKAEASATYNVPPKTLDGRLRAEAIKASSGLTEEESKKAESQEKQYQFMEEIKTVLTYTNATPYKTKSGQYYCAYCPEDKRKVIDEPDELRTHTRTEHLHERLKKVEIFMRPSWLNEVLKVDILNLLCTVCFTPIQTWNDMFKHLEEKHDVHLDQAYTRIIPYRLTDELECALCSNRYSRFHILDAHMNAHYDSYICDECGETFLAENRLKKHIKTHETGRHPCEYCSKVFTLDKYRKKHVIGVHYKDCRFKCRYCSEVFRAEYPRHLHIMKHHKEKIKVLTCELCGRTFDWRPYYLKHLRLKHKQREKKHKCKICSKSFWMKYELRNHEAVHRGANYCSICKKDFSSKQYLQKHIKKHEDGSLVVIMTQDSDEDQNETYPENVGD